MSIYARAVEAVEAALDGRERGEVFDALDSEALNSMQRLACAIVAAPSTRFSEEGGLAALNSSLGVLILAQDLHLPLVPEFDSPGEQYVTELWNDAALDVRMLALNVVLNLMGES